MLPRVRSNWFLKLIPIGLTLLRTMEKREEASCPTTRKITTLMQMKQMVEHLVQGRSPSHRHRAILAFIWVPLSLLSLIQAQGSRKAFNSSEHNIPSSFLIPGPDFLPDSVPAGLADVPQPLPECFLATISQPPLLPQVSGASDMSF